MRALDRLPEESSKAYRAFALYRDLGPDRTLRAVAEALYGVRWKYGKRTVEKWSSTFDWVARAWDDFLDMERRVAVEDHERGRAQDLAARRETLRRRNLENEERAAALTSKVLDVLEAAPLVRERTTRYDEDGRPIETVIEPVLSASFDLVAQRLHRIATRSEPTKIAPTDPSGESEYGQSAEDIDREFEEMLGEGDDEADKGEGRG